MEAIPDIWSYFPDFIINIKLRPLQIGLFGFVESNKKNHKCRHYMVLNSVLWRHLRKEERRDTVIHELCHIYIYRRYGRSVADHGKEWQAAMKRAGLIPSTKFPNSERWLAIAEKIKGKLE